MSDKIILYEVGPRDGLQNEKAFLPTDKKVALIDRLSRCGFSKIEATSFVSPKWVPQLADGQKVMTGIQRHVGVSYAALTPNFKGYQAAKEAKVDEVAIFASASEGFSQKNINCSIAESLERFKPVVEAAHQDGIPVRGYVSCVVACPYDGDVDPEEVAKVVSALRGLGCYEISLGDTIGAGTPDKISDMLQAALADTPAGKLAGHFHDTGGRAMSNIEISLEKGLRTFDTAIGGLGGCPYAPGAKGNVETLLVHDRLVSLGFETGLDRAALVDAGRFLNQMIEEQSHG